MMKLILLTTVFSVTQMVIADATDTSKVMSKPAIDMVAANKAHASIPQDAKKDAPFWSKDQLRQSALEKKYKEDIAKSPDNKKTYAYLAGLYLTNNKTTQAIDAYQDAITHDSENPKLFAALSIAYLHHSKYDMAKAMADQALRLNPDMKGVKKINEYVVAKQAAIDAASQIPASAVKVDMTKSSGLHGSLMPVAAGNKPADKIHNPNPN